MSVQAKCFAQAQYAGTSAASIYACPSPKTAIVDKMTATNISGSTRTFSVHVVASGGSASNDNLITSALSLAAGESADVPEMKNQILNTGDAIYVLASAASAVVTRVSGREIT